LNLNPCDADLLDRVRRGDPAALGAVYELLADDVYRVALRITDSVALADDVTQDVFVGLPEALVKFDGRKLESWLKKVTVRTALMHVRADNRKREVPLTQRAQKMMGSVPHGGLDRYALERALSDLSKDLRAVFILKEVEGMAHAEIADVLGISVAASQVRLHRARERLRVLLKGSE
jgi:RNA polymerase sigma-70 factor, ECF subfamily